MEIKSGIRAKLNMYVLAAIRFFFLSHPISHIIQGPVLQIKISCFITVTAFLEKKKNAASHK